LFLLPAFAKEEKRTTVSPWEHSIVTIETARRQYDYYQPWAKRTKKVQKSGVVIGDHQILTTADEMFDRTLVRLQKGGRGQWYLGEVTWIDYPANLALVTASDTNFWKSLTPAALGGGLPDDGALQIMRWREGNLENRRAEFTQFTVREGQLSPVNHVVLEADSEMLNAGFSEPLVEHSRVAGLVLAQRGRTCTVLPSSLMEAVVQAHQHGPYRGFGYFHFYWQPAENPASLERLKLPGTPRGVIVIQVPKRPDADEQVLKADDVILKIDGFDLDIEGDYNDPEFGHLMLENLATRRKWAGDDVKMQLWRDGKPLDVTYRLPKFQYTNSLVPQACYDQEPEYLISGGLVFEPLTDAYLQSWGPEWKERAPFRLNYYNAQEPTKERPSLVILSQILPDAYNIGYQEQKWLVVDKVNGQRISNLAELHDALQKPAEGYHVIEFMRGESLRKIVLAAGDAERQATQRILKRYGIADESRLASATSAAQIK
jgi:hypothetical protein